MNSPFDIGLNRTGIATSPTDGPKMIESAEKAGITTSDGAHLASMRLDYVRDAEPIGRMPPPATLKGAVKTAAQALKGEKANVLLDKLGERLAFERAGTRLYELALLKAQVFPSWEGGPSRDELREIQREELAHFGLLQEAIEKLGADPTAMTPSADLTINLSKGIPAVLADPRTSLRECMEGLLIAELADNNCWEMLIVLARQAGQEQLATAFEDALREEERHLRLVKGWLSRGTLAALEKKLPEASRTSPPPP